MSILIRFNGAWHIPVVNSLNEVLVTCGLRPPQLVECFNDVWFRPEAIEIIQRIEDWFDCEDIIGYVVLLY